ncbi:hypothetical protein, partial [uncultured Varibaculum sp.]|uniref:hypothetical protein n=1 Tax=uncultured Varibaculum sp. TaxID=413896 RepID=UPI00288C4658
TPPAFILSQDQTLQQKPKKRFKPENNPAKTNTNNQKTKRSKIISIKKTKTRKNQTHPKNKASPVQSHTNKTKKHTIENTNNQTTNQPNWPVRIRREQKISGGKVFLPPASALGNEYKVTVREGWRQTRRPKSKGSHKNL